MHELSIAQSLINLASQTAREAGSSVVIKLNIRMGLLSGIGKNALLFSFGLAAEGTPCAGAELAIEEVPVSVMCPHCEEVKFLVDQYCFQCPICGTPTPQILSGQELELVSLEIAAEEVAA